MASAMIRGDGADAYRCVQCFTPCCDMLCPAALGFRLIGSDGCFSAKRTVQAQLHSIVPPQQQLSGSHAWRWRQVETQRYYGDLPQDVLLQIMGHLRIIDLLQASLVSVHWRRTSQSPSLWSHLDLMHCGHSVDLRRVHAMAPSCRSLALRGDRCWRHDLAKLRVLCAWGGLQSLTVGEVSLAPGALTELAGALPSLRTLRLRSECHFFGNGCIKALPAACPHLTHLTLLQSSEDVSLVTLREAGREPLTPRALYELADSPLAKRLREVHLAGYHLLPPPDDLRVSGGWCYLFSCCPHLEIVDVNVYMRLEMDEANSEGDLLYFEHEEFIDAIIEHLAASCAALNLHYFRDASLDCLGRLGEMTNLTHLDVRMCEEMDAECLTSLLQGCERLLHLGLTTLTAAELQGPLANAALLPRLRTLSVCDLDEESAPADALLGAILLGELRALHVGHGDTECNLAPAQLRALITRCPHLERAYFECYLGSGLGGDDSAPGTGRTRRSLSWALRMIRDGWPQLIQLEIAESSSSCSQEDLLELAHALPHMRHIDVCISCVDGPMPWAVFVVALAWKWRELTYFRVGRQRRAPSAVAWASGHELRDLCRLVRRACPELVHCDLTAARGLFHASEDADSCRCTLTERVDGLWDPDAKPFAIGHARRITGRIDAWQAQLRRSPTGQVLLGPYKQLHADGSIMYD
jgi:hypothetical protein